MHTYEFLSTSPTATVTLGERLGKVLREGSVIALTGELGCGKTLLTRGICTGLGVNPRQVNSPTFVLVNEYRGRVPVFHLDVYRLNGTDDAVELGILDYLNRTHEGVMLVEWAEKIAGALPGDRLTVTFTRVSARQRKLGFSTESDRYVPLFKELKKA